MCIRDSASRDDVRNAAQVHFKALAVQQAVIAALNADHTEALMQAGAYHLSLIHI